MPGKTFFDKIDRERSLTRSREVKTIEQLCRITLAADAPHHYDIPWCEGLGRRTVLYVLEPGKSIIWPKNKTVSFFGPFDLEEEYERTTDERKLNELREIISTEKARYVNRYDYPRGKSGEILGPHNSPDVTIELLGSEGNAERSWRLYEIYGLGEFDDVRFDHKPSEAELKAHYDAQLRERDKVLEDARREMAELRGMLIATAAAPSNGHSRKQKRPHPPNCQCAAHKAKNQQELVAAS
jgi:hypothetical protein